jgi:hypothetical protein
MRDRLHSLQVIPHDVNKLLQNVMSGLVPWTEDIKQVPSMSVCFPAIEIFVSVLGDHAATEDLGLNIS